MPNQPEIGASMLLFMHARRRRNLELGHAVRDWNQRHLSRHATRAVTPRWAASRSPNALPSKSWPSPTADADSVVFSLDVCITQADGCAQH